MKILFDARAYHFSGVGRYIRELLAHFPNDQITLLANKPIEGGFDLLLTDILPYTLAEQTMLPKIIKKAQPDLIHFTSIARPWTSFKNSKTITTIHDFTLLNYSAKPYFEIKSELKRSALKGGMKRIINNSQMIITPSEYVKKQTLKLASKPTKIEVISHGFSSSIVAQKPVKSLPEKFYFYVGNAYSHKNLGLLVRALEAKADLHFVVAGDPQSGYQNLHHPRLIKLGKVSDAQLSYLYQKAEAFVFPSKSEGFGLPGLEALSYGCPLVSSEATALPEIYGDSAIYFDPNSVDDLLLGLEQVNTKKNQLKKEAKKQLKLYSWSACAEQTLSAYQAVLEK